jgi:hypothetical protein
VASVLQAALSGEMTPEEAQRLGGVVETLVVGKKLDQMESQLKAIDASGVRPMVTQAPESEKPTWGRGLEKVQGAVGRARAELGLDEV